MLSEISVETFCVCVITNAKQESFYLCGENQSKQNEHNETTNYSHIGPCRDSNKHGIGMQQ